MNCRRFMPLYRTAMLVPVLAASMSAQYAIPPGMENVRRSDIRRLPNKAGICYSVEIHHPSGDVYHELYCDRYSNGSGVDTVQTFARMLDGSVRSLEIHVTGTEEFALHRNEISAVRMQHVIRGSQTGREMERRLSYIKFLLGERGV